MQPDGKTHHIDKKQKHMKTAILALAAAASALANAAVEMLRHIQGDAPTESEPEDNTDTPTAPATRGRGRPPKAAAETPAAIPAPVGKTYEELRALIEPLVEDGKGEDVKKIVGKYSQSGLKALPADKQAAFIRDIEALSL